MNYRPVAPGEHTLEVYPIGIRAGMAIRLKRDLCVEDHEGRTTDEVHPTREVWTVLAGLPEEPGVIWPRKAGGDLHTWDDASLLDWFEVLADDPAQARHGRPG